MVPRSGDQFERLIGLTKQGLHRRRFSISSIKFEQRYTWEKNNNPGEKISR